MIYFSVFRRGKLIFLLKYLVKLRSIFISQGSCYFTDG